MFGTLGGDASKDDIGETPTVRVYQVHRGGDDRLKNKNCKDFLENRLVIYVTEPDWLESGERLPKKIWGNYRLNFIFHIFFIFHQPGKPERGG